MNIEAKDVTHKHILQYLTYSQWTPINSNRPDVANYKRGRAVVNVPLNDRIADYKTTILNLIDTLSKEQEIDKEEFVSSLLIGQNSIYSENEYTLEKDFPKTVKVANLDRTVIGNRALPSLVVNVREIEKPKLLLGFIPMGKQTVLEVLYMYHPNFVNVDEYFYQACIDSDNKRARLAMCVAHEMYDRKDYSKVIIYFQGHEKIVIPKSRYMQFFGKVIKKCKNIQNKSYIYDNSVLTLFKRTFLK